MDLRSIGTSAGSTIAPAAQCPSSASDPIYVDIGPLREKYLTGIGRFVARLVEALAKVAPLNLFTTAGRQCISVRLADLPECDASLDAWAHHLVGRPGRLLDLRTASRSAALYTALRPAERYFRRELGILYDFTALLLPWAHAEETRTHFGHFFAQTSARCDKLVAISQSTKRDARWLCAAANADIAVAYPGPSLCVRRHAHPGPVTRRSDGVLVVSTLEPRKNASFLLDWFATTDALAPGTELWWVGPEGWWASRDLIASLRGRHRGGRGARIKLLGMVSDRRLCELYQQAAFTIYPSLYEGFGFPVLDSLWHGTPVLSSFNSSLQEFAGPGVFFFDAGDPHSVDTAYREMAGSRPVRIDREALQKRFSWDALAGTIVGLCA
jgi:glycosyltransferase involved in cell wall biosynthesis